MLVFPAKLHANRSRFSGYESCDQETAPAQGRRDAGRSGCHELVEGIMIRDPSYRRIGFIVRQAQDERSRQIEFFQADFSPLKACPVLADAATLDVENRVC